MDGIKGALAHLMSWNVRFGSLADIGQPIRDVRFAPKADMLSVEIDVRFVPLADITKENRTGHFVREVTKLYCSGNL
jgi:hypothetical protein